MQTSARTVALAVLAFLGTPGVPPTTAAAAGSEGWTRQWGTTGADEAQGVTVDRAGNAYVSGWVLGNLPDQAPAGTVDAFVRKYDAAGREVWTRQFGSWDRDFARAMAMDPAGNAYVVGETQGTLPGQLSAGGLDAFVRKYDQAGNELWTRQFGGGGGDAAWGVAVNAAGQTYVAGATRAALPGQRSAGNHDAFVRKYDPAGNELWTRQFGSLESEGARSVALSPSENVMVVGSTDGTLPGQNRSGGLDAYLRQYDPAGNELWTHQFGSEEDDFGMAVVVDNMGDTLVVGSAGRALPGQITPGGSGAFISSFDAAGAVLWTQHFGADISDEAWGVTVDSAARSYVVGSTVRGLPGQQPVGGADIFLRQYDPSGNEMSTRQFGTPEADYPYALAVDGTGHHRIAGSTKGAFPGQASAGDRDAFVMSVAQ
jgi:beta-propeller repeat-containing protein